MHARHGTAAAMPLFVMKDQPIFQLAGMGQGGALGYIGRWAAGTFPTRVWPATALLSERRPRLCGGTQDARLWAATALTLMCWMGGAENGCAEERAAAGSGAAETRGQLLTGYNGVLLGTSTQPAFCDASVGALRGPAPVIRTEGFAQWFVAQQLIHLNGS